MEVYNVQRGLGHGKNIETAQFNFDIGDKQKAYSVHKEIIKENPNIPEAWYGIAQCVSDIEKKKYCLQRALQLNTNYQDAKQALKVILDHQVTIDKQTSIGQEKQIFQQNNNTKSHNIPKNNNNWGLELRNAWAQISTLEKGIVGVVVILLSILLAVLSIGMINKHLEVKPTLIVKTIQYFPTPTPDNSRKDFIETQNQ